MTRTAIALATAFALTLIACEQPKEAPAPKTSETTGASTEGTGLPGTLDPKARMDEVKKDYEKALETGTKNIDRGVERSLGEGEGK